MARMRFTSKNLKSPSKAQNMPPPRRTTRPRIPTTRVDEILLDSSEDESPKTQSRSSIRTPKKGGGDDNSTTDSPKRGQRVRFSEDPEASEAHEEVVATNGNAHELVDISAASIEGEEGVLSMEVEVVDGSGTKLQKLSVPVVKLNIPDLNFSSKQVPSNEKEFENKGQESDEGSDVDDNNEKSTTSRSLRGGGLSKTSTKNGEGSEEEVDKEPDDEGKIGNKLRSSRTRNPNDSSVSNRRQSNRVTAPSRKYFTDSESYSSDDAKSKRPQVKPANPKSSEIKTNRTRPLVVSPSSSSESDSGKSEESDPPYGKRKRAGKQLQTKTKSTVRSDLKWKGTGQEEWDDSYDPRDPYGKKKRMQNTNVVARVHKNVGRGRPKTLPNKQPTIQETSEDSDATDVGVDNNHADKVSGPKNTSPNTGIKRAAERIVSNNNNNAAPKKSNNAKGVTTSARSLVTSRNDRVPFGTSTPTKLDTASSSCGIDGVDEEYRDLQKLYLAKQIEVLDHDLYLKKLEALQKERALNLPESAFTIDLCNQ